MQRKNEPGEISTSKQRNKRWKELIRLGGGGDHDSRAPRRICLAISIHLSVERRWCSGPTVSSPQSSSAPPPSGDHRLAPPHGKSSSRKFKTKCNILSKRCFNFILKSWTIFFSIIYACLGKFNNDSSKKQWQIKTSGALGTKVFNFSKK